MTATALRALLASALLAPALAHGADAAPLPPPPPPPAAPVPAPVVKRPRAPVGFDLAMGFDFGSTELAYVKLSNGSTDRLRANEGFYFTGGLSFLRQDVGAAQLDTVASLGVKGWTAGASNGSFNYLSFPVEVLERWQYDWFRAGVGLDYQLSPTVKADGLARDVMPDDVGLKSSLGVVLQAEWVSRDMGMGRVGAGARVLLQKLRNPDVGASISANSFGLFLGWQPR